LSILNYSSVLFYELTPDDVELAGDAGIQHRVLDLEDETAYEGRIYFGLEDQSAAGLFLDQIPETVLASGSDVNKSLISMGFIIILLYIFINEPSIFWGTVPQANALQKFKKGLEETDESAGIFIKLYYN